MKLKKLLRDYQSYSTAIKMLKTEIDGLTELDPGSKRIPEARKMLKIKERNKGIVDKILNELPWEESEVLKLRFVNELPADQVARKIYKTERTIYYLQRKALSKANEILKAME